MKFCLYRYGPRCGILSIYMAALHYVARDHVFFLDIYMYLYTKISMRLAESYVWGSLRSPDKYIHKKHVYSH